MMKTGYAVRMLNEETGRQQQRLENLYGPGDYGGTIKRNIRKTIWLALISGLFFLLVIALQVHKSSGGTQGMVLDGDGNITAVQRPGAGEASIVLSAQVVAESGEQLTDKDIQLLVLPHQKQKAGTTEHPPGAVDGVEDGRQYEIRKTIYQLNRDTTVQTVALPQKLADGTRIYWVPQKTNDWMILLLIVFLTGYAVYRNRDAGLVKTEKAARDSVLRDLPEFVNKLVLLLNAGLILSNAFNKIVSDHEKARGGESSYFYGQLTQIMTKCCETNGSVQQEIRNFAVRTGIVEFMRLSNIISDSMTKGSDLMTQLKMEGDSLWAARKKQLEEKGKIAETKLTFPLVILLLVLVMITIAPAMMEM